MAKEIKTVYVELLCPRGTNTGTQRVGDVVEVTENEAKRMIEKGQAREAEPAEDWEQRG